MGHRSVKGSGWVWVLVPGPMRIAAMLVALWGAQTLVYGYWSDFSTLPAPFDTRAASLAVGVLALATGVGILRAHAWARAAGLLVVALWALELLVAMAANLPASLGDFEWVLAFLASWAVGLLLVLFVGRQLALRWPVDEPRPLRGPSLTRSIALYIGALVLLSGLALLLKPPEPGPFVPPEPLGPGRAGGHIELAHAGFALDLPSDWSVEVRTPERDPATAEPGEAWEALRAFDPALRRTCSVSIAVSPGGGSLDDYGFGSTSGGDEAPNWTGPARQPTLMVPDSASRVEPHGGPTASHLSGLVRYASAGREHDILYAIECGGDPWASFDRITESLALVG